MLTVSLKLESVGYILLVA